MVPSLFFLPTTQYDGPYVTHVHKGYLMHKHIWAAAALLTFAILACGPLDASFLSDDAFEQEIAAGSAFEPTACPFDYPASYTIECGYLYVPENRSTPASREIELAVAIIRSPNPDKAPDPLIYLAGGPGGSALYEADIWADSAFVEERDIILMDQRGTGYSFPQLDCPEDNEGSGVDPCVRRANRQNIDLGAYNSAESAADLEDLRLALGIDEWNMLGVSYGTRLAMTYMRDFGDNGALRSVILDSVYPPDINAYTLQSVNTFEALDTLFAGCAADPACSQAYPNLAERFYRLVVELEEDPLFFTAYDADYDEDVEFELWGYDLMNEVFQALYETPTIPYLPKLINDVEQGDTTLIGDWMLGYALGETAQTGAEGFFFPDVDYIDDSELLYYTVECYDEVAFADTGEAYTLTEGYPPLLRDLLQDDLEALIETCGVLGLPQTPALEALPVSSNVPTLLTAGEYDPVTPPGWAELAERSLGNDTFVVFPGVGHATLDAGPCPVGVMQAFLAAPQTAPDLSCVAQMGPPDWVLP